MRQETITRTYLKFEELTDAQKRQVLDRYRDINTDGLDWFDFVYEDYISELKSLGFYDIDICFSGFWSQGDGASFTAKHERGDIYRIGRYYHENSMCIDSDDKDLLNDAKNIARRLYKDLEKTYDYMTSDEAVSETLVANDYEFDSETLKMV